MWHPNQCRACRTFLRECCSRLSGVVQSNTHQAHDAQLHAALDAAPQLVASPVLSSFACGFAPVSSGPFGACLPRRIERVFANATELHFCTDPTRMARRRHRVVLESRIPWCTGVGRAAAGVGARLRRGYVDRDLDVRRESVGL